MHVLSVHHFERGGAENGVGLLKKARGLGIREGSERAIVEIFLLSDPERARSGQAVRTGDRGRTSGGCPRSPAADAGPFRIVGWGIMITVVARLTRRATGVEVCLGTPL
jgi:hypothetical protein